MQTYDAKRVEIIIEAPLESRLTDALIEAGVTGYTVLPVSGGYGRSGRWSRAGQVSRASGMVSVVCLVSPDKVDDLLDAAFAVVERHIGVVSVTDAQVVRPNASKSYIYTLKRLRGQSARPANPRSGRKAG